MNRITSLYVEGTLGIIGFLYGGISVSLFVNQILEYNSDIASMSSFFIGGAISAVIISNNPYAQKIKNILDT